MGHVRHPLRGPPRPAPPPDVRGVRGPPAAQGLPDQPAPAADRAERTERMPRTQRASASWSDAGDARAVPRRGRSRAARTSTSTWARPTRPCTASSASSRSWTARWWSRPTWRSATCTAPSRRTARPARYNNAIPYTDRLNYVSPAHQQLRLRLRRREAPRHRDHRALQVHPRDHERDLADLRPPDVRRARRAMELGAFTVFLYMIKAREFLWELVEDVTGARLTISYGRVGGVKADLPDGLRPQGAARPSRRRGRCSTEVHTLLTGNRIFMDRMVGRGRALRARTAIAWGITGTAPARGRRALRPAPGAALLGLRPVEFEVAARQERRQLRPLPRPHGRDGAVHAHRRAGARRHARRRHQRGLRGAGEIPADAYVDRGKQGKTEGLLLMPDHALAQSRRARSGGAHARVNVARQARGAAAEGDGLRLHRGPDEPLHARHGRLRHPAARRARPTSPVEGANGELGFYVVSDGSDRPYRVRCRPPCLPPVAALPRMIEGQMIADIIPTFGSVNMIGGRAGPAEPMADAEATPQFTRRAARRGAAAPGALPGQARRAPARAAPGPGHLRLRLARGRGVRRRALRAARPPTSTRS